MLLDVLPQTMSSDPDPNRGPKLHRSSLHSAYNLPPNHRRTYNMVHISPKAMPREILTFQAPVTSALILSLLTSLGGAIGYARTGSIPSIAAGFAVGFVYLLSFLRLRNGQSYGEELGLLASVVLGGSSIPRVIKTGGKPVPLGLSLLATYGLWVFGIAYRERK